jgi:hypothetical protein
LVEGLTLKHVLRRDLNEAAHRARNGSTLTVRAEVEHETSRSRDVGEQCPEEIVVELLLVV